MKIFIHLPYCLALFLYLKIETTLTTTIYIDPSSPNNCSENNVETCFSPNLVDALLISATSQNISQLYLYFIGNYHYILESDLPSSQLQVSYNLILQPNFCRSNTQTKCTNSTEMITINIKTLKIYFPIYIYIYIYITYHTKKSLSTYTTN